MHIYRLNCPFFHLMAPLLNNAFYFVFVGLFFGEVLNITAPFTLLTLLVTDDITDLLKYYGIL